MTAQPAQPIQTFELHLYISRLRSFYCAQNRTILHKIPKSCALCCNFTHKIQTNNPGGSKVAKMYSYSKLNKELSPKITPEITKKQELSTTSIKNERPIRVDLSFLDAIPTHWYDTSGEEPENKRKRKLRR